MKLAQFVTTYTYENTPQWKTILNHMPNRTEKALQRRWSKIKHLPQYKHPFPTNSALNNKNKRNNNTKSHKKKSK